MTDLAADVQTLSVEVQGMTFAALTWSPADPTGRAAGLCLHRYPDTPYTWRELGPFLAARGWHVVAQYTRDVPECCPCGRRKCHYPAFVRSWLVRFHRFATDRSIAHRIGDVVAPKPE